MSWTLVKEVRDARKNGLLKELTASQFLILLLLADTCRKGSRVANIGIQELLTLTGHRNRTAMSRTLTQLEIDHGCIRQLTRGNQHQVASYEITSAACDFEATCDDDESDSARCPEATSGSDSDPSARCTEATCGDSARDSEATSGSSARDSEATSGDPHVALECSARCPTATYPYTPTEDSRVSTPDEERADAIDAPTATFVDAHEVVDAVEAEAFTTQQTNGEHYSVPKYIDNPQRKPKQYPSNAALTVVRQVLGDVDPKYPKVTLDRLASEVAKLARAGHPDRLVRKALVVWHQRPNCTNPALLPHILGDLVAEEHSQQGAVDGDASTSKMRTLAQWAAEQRELESVTQIANHAHPKEIEHDQHC